VVHAGNRLTAYRGARSFIRPTCVTESGGSVAERGRERTRKDGASGVDGCHQGWNMVPLSGQGAPAGAQELEPSTLCGEERSAPPRRSHLSSVPARGPSPSPRLSLATLACGDLLGVAAAVLVVVGARYLLLRDVNVAFYVGLWPVLGVFLAVYLLMGLYSSVGVNPAEELRRTTLATSMVFLLLGSHTFLFRTAEWYSRQVLLTSWVLALIAVPLVRALVRYLFARRSWWGHGAVVLGAGKTGRMVVEILAKRPEFGLKPLAAFDDDPSRHGDLFGVPVAGGLDAAPSVARELGASYAIVAMPGVRRQRLVSLLETHASTFRHLLVIPDLFGMSSLWVAARDLGGVLGLEARPQLLRVSARLAKRAMDIAVTLLAGVAVLPLVVLVALAIRLTSRGPVFYGHSRLGRLGKPFTAWKFRSMVRNGDQVLAEHLARFPHLRREWERTQKLQDDPRVTRVGRFLRRTSMDELPQLWNVLRGDMSLVGPRPIVADEVRRYGGQFPLCAQVSPGLSGLWQVSGRNSTTYEERVRLDSYYVRNWSVFLDLYILARTIPVVLLGRGAC